MSEYQEQRELIRWYRETYPQYSKCIRLSLNGVSLPPGPKAAIARNQFKSQGMVLAEADLLFCVPNLIFHGLFIEMKDFGKKATTEQQEYLDFMQSMGYQACICEGAEAAKRVISDYMVTSFVAI